MGGTSVLFLDLFLNDVPFQTNLRGSCIDENNLRVGAKTAALGVETEAYRGNVCVVLYL